MSVWRPEFVAAMQLFATISTAMRRRGFTPPVLVGGAAVEIYSAGAVATGDFDLVSGRQDILEAILVEHGFERPSGPGVATRGWVHPALGLGFEIVGSTLLDGLAEQGRVRLFEARPDQHLSVIAVEDLIADRMGQYASGTARDMLEQARILFDLYPDADMAYLERRIRQETLDEYGIADLQR